MFPILSIDPALGRLDYESLSDQALMEMLFDGMQEKYKRDFWDENQNFIDKCDWEGIECKDDRPTTIDVEFRTFAPKQFPFEFIPPLVAFFSIHRGKVHGTLNTAVLPNNLEFFMVFENCLHGPLCLKSIPSSIRDRFDVSTNSFSGSLELSELPERLCIFDGSFNKFEGEISLDSLPRSMTQLCLQRNMLSGSVCISHLPASMEGIYLARNGFFGDLRFLDIPESFRNLSMIDNPMSGKIILMGTDDEIYLHLHMNTIRAVVDEKGNTHAWEDAVIAQNAHDREFAILLEEYDE